jgi:hypothetical protein
MVSTSPVSALRLVIAMSLLTGCFEPAALSSLTDADTDDEFATDGGQPVDPAETDAGDGTDSDGESGDASGEAPEACDPTRAPMDEDCVLDDGLGVFVATWGDDAGPGTQDAPLATLAAAIQRAAAGSRRVYACAQDFAGAKLVVASDVALFGGLDCDDDWHWIGDTRRTRYSTDGIGLQIAGPIDVLVEDVDLVSADATTAHGASSIAVVVQGAKRALFRRSRIAAGNASAGGTASAVAWAAAAGPRGEDGRSADCLPVTTEMFGHGAPNPFCPETAGGSGGGPSEFGDAGSPEGSGGAGGTVSTYPLTSSPGEIGLDGSDGGDGEPARGLGSLELDGWIAPTAAPGWPGAVGGGGGGGGGGFPGGLSCDVSESVVEYDILAPGGGAGGAGGCGGASGGPGTSGGSSIALVSIDANVVLESATLHSADGGDGGAGAPGQAGGEGGEGGIGGEPHEGSPAAGSGVGASAGGSGGRGGRGGTGGGGAGGHSLGIAYRGATPLLGVGVEFVLGSAGVGGGTVRGDDGVTAEALAIE